MILFLSRNFLSNRNKPLSINAFLSILGIVVGCIALTVTVAIMNGLQKNIIDAMIEIDSYHIRIQGQSATNIYKNQNILDSLSKIKSVVSVFPFSDSEAVLKAQDGKSTNILLKSIPNDIFLLDSGFNSGIRRRSPNQDELIKEDEILVAGDLFSRLNLKKNSYVYIMPIIQKDIFHPKSYKLKIKNSFLTDLIDYNDLMVLTSLDNSFIESKNIMIAIKVKNKYNIKKPTEEITKLLKEFNIDVENDISNWHSYNKAVYSALSIEKNTMTILVSLIFLVVSINLGQNLSKIVYKKKNEIAILFSIGLDKEKMTYSLVFSSLVIGICGSSFGMIFGYLIYKNLKSILKFIFNSNYNYTYGLLSSIKPYLYLSDGIIIYLIPIVLCIIFSINSIIKLSKINVIDILKNEM